MLSKMVVAYTGHGNVPRTRFLSCSELGRSLSLQLPPQLGAISKPGAKRIREGIYNHPVQRVEQRLSTSDNRPLGLLGCLSFEAQTLRISALFMHSSCGRSFTARRLSDSADRSTIDASRKYLTLITQNVKIQP